MKQEYLKSPYESSNQNKKWTLTQRTPSVDAERVHSSAKKHNVCHHTIICLENSSDIFLSVTSTEEAL